MPAFTQEYIRRKFLEQFARMSPERREGTIEALTVLHEEGIAQAEKPATLPLLESEPEEPAE